MLKKSKGLVIGKMAALICGGSREAEEKNVLNSVEILTIERSPSDGNKWKIHSSFGPTMARPRRAAVSIQNKSTNQILVIGGCSQPSFHEKSVEILQNLNTDSVWQMKEDILVHGRSCMAAAAIDDNKCVLFGGYDGAECLKSVEIVDLITMTSRYLWDLPCCLKNATATSEKEDIYIFGGWDGERTLRTVFKYDIRDGHCSIEALLPGPIECHAMARVDDHVFIIGGFDGISVVGSIVLFDLKSQTCENLDVCLKIARENHCAEVLDDRFLMVYGGWTGFETIGSVEVFEIVNRKPYLISVNHSQFSLQVNRNRSSSCLLKD